jgi:Tfp pilus assembly protein PilZ
VITINERYELIVENRGKIVHSEIIPDNYRVGDEVAILDDLKEKGMKFTSAGCSSLGLICPEENCSDTLVFKGTGWKYTSTKNNGLKDRVEVYIHYCPTCKKYIALEYD